jgi:hypothetical protein
MYQKTQLPNELISSVNTGGGWCCITGCHCLQHLLTMSLPACCPVRVLCWLKCGANCLIQAVTAESLLVMMKADADVLLMHAS